jgi:hypothetical protein
MKTIDANEHSKEDILSFVEAAIQELQLQTIARLHGHSI